MVALWWSMNAAINTCWSQRFREGSNNSCVGIPINWKISLKV